MNEKVAPNASNRRKKELAREGDLLTYKRKRKTIDLSIVVPPSTVDTANEGVSEPVPPTEGAGNSLSLRKLKKYYAYKLEKVLRDGTTAAAKKKNGLTTRSVARAYILYVLGSFLFPIKKGTNVSARYLYLFAKDKVVCDPYRDKRDSAHAFKEVTFFYGALTSPDHVQPYYPNRVMRQFNREQDIPAMRLLTEVFNLWNAKEPKKFNPKYEWVDCFSGQKWKEFILKKTDRGRRTTIYPITVDLATNDDVGIHQRKKVNVNEQGDTPVHQSEDVAEQYDASIQKLKEDKEKESEANTKLREDLKDKTSECDLLKETIKKIKEDIQLKCVVDEQCTLEFADLPRQLDAKCKESESLKAVNALLMEQIDLHLPPATPLVGLQSHQPVLDVTLVKKYDDLLATHEDVKKKLIMKEDFVSYSK
ncbi:hypothetical protein GIB67_028592 [Kingdonia uniflora]|uniref:Uncharacterized protein n=1 Tax=Kingdonia uniflora TaxID=39325 RepID=A0A7J7KZE1_9MAGN|nr:hypothetical protein GIB67_028592 [Kingdonia uniflora]